MLGSTNDRRTKKQFWIHRNPFIWCAVVPFILFSIHFPISRFSHSPVLSRHLFLVFICARLSWTLSRTLLFDSAELDTVDPLPNARRDMVCNGIPVHSKIIMFEFLSWRVQWNEKSAKNQTAKCQSTYVVRQRVQLCVLCGCEQTIHLHTYLRAPACPSPCT